MKISNFSTVFLLTVLSSCLVYSIGYQHSFQTVRQVPVSLIIKPVTLNAVVDINPETLNLHSKGRWITSYIELPSRYKVSDIDVSAIKLNDTVLAESRPTAIGDYDKDTIPDLMVKFDKASVISYILDQGIRYSNVTLAITGKLNDETPFQGSDTIKIMLPRSMPHG